MSRHITFTAKFANGKKVTYGAYNKTNAEYKQSLIPNEKVYSAIHNLVNHIEGKRIIKNIRVTINVSTGYTDINMCMPSKIVCYHSRQLLEHTKVNSALYYTKLVNNVYRPNRK